MNLPKSIVIDAAIEDYNPGLVQVCYNNISKLDFSGFSDVYLSANEQKALCGKSFEEVVNFLIPLNSINYQYWDMIDNQFSRYQNKNLTGALAAFSSFDEFYHTPNCKLEHMEFYFGNIPALNSRVEILQESLNPQLLSCVYEEISAAINNTVIDSTTAYNISRIMPKSFSDRYLKKIQLALYEIALYAKSCGYNVRERLTVAADYQLPKVLEAKGLLKYHSSLLYKIQNHELITEGSEEEKAIRAATILACERIHSEHSVSIPLIDRWLWLARNDYPEKNFHLTFTTCY